MESRLNPGPQAARLRGALKAVAALAALAVGSWAAHAQTDAPAKAQASAKAPAAARTAEALVDGSAVFSAASLALHWGDFAEAERLFKAARAQPRRTSAGLWEVVQLYRGFENGLSTNRGLRVRQAEHTAALSAQWVQQHPRSPLAHALHVVTLTNLAWAHRGSGYANTVAPQAWELFRAALDKATAHAVQHGDVLLSDGLGFQALLVVARGAGWDDRRTQAIYEQGILRFPDEDLLHFTQLTNLLPKWGGSARQVDQHIQAAAQRTRAPYGPALYARLYTAAAREQFEHALFADSLARWERVDAGYAEMTARYPHAGHFNAWAWMACQAQDRKRLLEVLEKIGPEPDLDFWGSNAQETYDTCKSWAQKL
ncbi:hypothetical protein [Rubrivivax rivuli]|uniref:DUF4034 domain-containing protein n=1 Tax=Rubrivivax rivuli TaxID=1862385 RepID=A0A437RRY0_9BURK|nr:hypothetical protein [Rubrivivax rivuli]RVU49546.1 hypothetical protein EOE66_02980 [Rubrivivax rivuli]